MKAVRQIFSIVLLSFFCLKVLAQPAFSPKNIYQLHNEVLIPSVTAQPCIFDFNYVYTNTDTKPYYLNVFVKNLSTNDAKWAIENLMLYPFPSARDLQYRMPLFDIFQEGVLQSSMGLNIMITDTIIVNPVYPAINNYDPFPITPDTIRMGPFGLPADTAGTDSTKKIPGNTWIKTDTSRAIVRGCNMPNIALDSSKNRPDSAYAGDWNACAPASCANSMQWLESIYPSKINSGLTIREKLRELSGMMKRANNGTSRPIDVVKAKMEFVDKHKLPIRVKFQSINITDSSVASPDTNYNHNAKNWNKDRANPRKNQISWEWLWGEVEHGEDVEIGIVELDVRRNRVINGHAVTLTGISETRGVRRFTYKDDRRQADSTGLREITFTLDTTTLGYIYLKEADRIRRSDSALLTRKFITNVFSESYDSTVVFTSVKQVKSNSGLNLKVYKNPFTDTEPLVIDFLSAPNKNLEITVTDIFGKIIHSRNGSAQQNNRFEWNGLNSNNVPMPAGIYIVTITVEDRSSVIKVQKQ